VGTSVTSLKGGRDATAVQITPAHKIILLGSLYLTQGVPFGFFTQAFPSLMRRQGYSLEAISAATVLALPWAAKFLWASAVDRYSFRHFGRRKSWLVPLQLLTTITLLSVALLPVGDLSVGVLTTVLLVNFMIATQDIAADALAVDVLAERERGVANGVQVAGYRLGMVIGGGILLIVFDRYGWTVTFASMAAIIAAASAPVLRYNELPHADLDRADDVGIRAFLRRPGAAYIIALVTTYKFGEAFAIGMVRPLLVDKGFGLSDIGAMLGIVGFGAVLIGGLTGGALVNALGRRKALIVFGVGQAAAVAGYAYMASHSVGRGFAYAVCAAEHFTSGMANAALFTCMMDWSYRETGATDYTLQASAVVIASGLASSLSGFSAGRFGYTSHFTLSLVLAGAAALLAATLYSKTPDAG
jgi:MFS transporter, PAT family, beta-lactamase induction signal transducer AmpG